VSFEEELVGVAAFLGVHGIETEVIDDEELGSEKLSELLLEGVEQARLLEGLEHVIGPKSEHGVTATTGEMSECVSEEGLSDADVADDGDVMMRADETQRGEFGEQSLVEVNLGGGVPVFESGAKVELSLLNPKSDRKAIATLSLVGEQGVEHARELQAP
jgi:hypothetical protein